MSDDLVKRARDALNGVTEGPWDTDTGGEVHRNGRTIFAWPVWSDQSDPDRIGADMEFAAAARELVPAMAARIEDMEAKLATAVGLLEAWVNVAAHCTIEEGVCCCGDNMDTHAEPMDCGHSPVDHGAYVASHLVDDTSDTLAELKGVKA